MAHTEVSAPTKKRILQTCVRMFLEKGYRKTTMAEILRESGVSNSSFQNIFGSKDGVVMELTAFMFSGQFGAARSAAGALPPVCVYAVEAAIQLTPTEMNKNLRGIYVRSYTQPQISDYIFRQTAKELEKIFSPYLPGLTDADFYRLEIGSAGIMRAYMARPCDEELTLEQKLHSFLKLSLRAYNVPQGEIDRAIAIVDSLDIRAISQQVLQKLLTSLQMYFEFTLPNPQKEEST